MSPIRGQGDVVVGVSCLIVDVSERVRAQRELVRLAEAAELGRDAVVSIDLEKRVCHWNRRAERLYGFAAEEAIGKRLTELTAMDEEPDHQIAQMLAGEPSYQYETQRRRKDGTIIDVLLTISPWHLDGSVVGVTDIAIDLSERKRDERARDRAIADFEEAQRIAAIGSWSWNPTITTTTASSSRRSSISRAACASERSRSSSARRRRSSCCETMGSTSRRGSTSGCPSRSRNERRPFPGFDGPSGSGTGRITDRSAANRIAGWQKVSGVWHCGHRLTAS
jgi:PAS domain S-box-containing protein